MALRSPAGGQRLAQQRAVGGGMGVLEAPHQFVQRVQHLLGEALGHLVLIQPAVGQHGGEAFMARQRQQPLLAQEQVQG